jgi:hypothetical protein
VLQLEIEAAEKGHQGRPQEFVVINQQQAAHGGIVALRAPRQINRARPGHRARRDGHRARVRP